MPFLTVESKSSGARTALPENRLQFYLFSYPIAELMNHQCDRFIDIAIEEPDSENLATADHKKEYRTSIVEHRISRAKEWSRPACQHC